MTATVSCNHSPLWSTPNFSVGAYELTGHAAISPSAVTIFNKASSTPMNLLLSAHDGLETSGSIFVECGAVLGCNCRPVSSTLRTVSERVCTSGPHSSFHACFGTVCIAESTGAPRLVTELRKLKETRSGTRPSINTISIEFNQTQPYSDGAIQTTVEHSANGYVARSSHISAQVSS